MLVGYWKRPNKTKRQLPTLRTLRRYSKVLVLYFLGRGVSFFLYYLWVRTTLEYSLNLNRNLYV